MERGHLDAFAEQRAFALFHEAGQPARVRLAETRRDDEISQRFANRIHARITKGPLRRRIPFDDAPLGVHGDDAIQR